MPTSVQVRMPQSFVPCPSADFFERPHFSVAVCYTAPSFDSQTALGHPLLRSLRRRGGTLPAVQVPEVLHVATDNGARVPVHLCGKKRFPIEVLKLAKYRSFQVGMEPKRKTFNEPRRWGNL